MGDTAQMSDERLIELIQQRDSGVSVILTSKRSLLSFLQVERATLILLGTDNAALREQVRVLRESLEAALPMLPYAGPQTVREQVKQALAATEPKEKP